MVELFAAGSITRTAGWLVGVHRNTAAQFFVRLRGLIAGHQERAMVDAFGGPVATDESYLGGHLKGKRGRGGGRQGGRVRCPRA